MQMLAGAGEITIRDLDQIVSSNETGKDHCRRGSRRRGSGYAAGTYMYYIIIIYITYIRMENID